MPSRAWAHSRGMADRARVRCCRAASTTRRWRGGITPAPSGSSCSAEAPNAPFVEPPHAVVEAHEADLFDLLVALEPGAHLPHRDLRRPVRGKPVRAGADRRERQARDAVAYGEREAA